MTLQETHMTAANTSLNALIQRLDSVVQPTVPTPQQVEGVRRALSDCLTTTGWLPDSCQHPVATGYARHLLHRASQDRFALVAMVWAPGQSTPIHDHGGVWCVEGVYAGKIMVTNYDPIGPLVDGGCRFKRCGAVESSVGGTGCLIPPVEYHTIAAAGEGTAVTLHVYGAELRSCNVFLPGTDGRYRSEPRALTYDTVWSAEA
jgi:predicted metal-dependent enzyme (double-stranded beta helix superfamily)